MLEQLECSFCPKHSKNLKMQVYNAANLAFFDFSQSSGKTNDRTYSYRGAQFGEDFTSYGIGP